MPKPRKSSIKTGATVTLKATGGSQGGGGNNPQTPNAPQPQSIADQTPSPANTPVTPNGVDAISKMSDDQLATLINSAVGVDMPNYLADIKDTTQNFVFAAGLNEKPLVLDKAAFDQYMKDNNISQSQIMSRYFDSGKEKSTNTPATYSKTANQVSDIIKYSRLNYIGGKVGGQAYGGGTYFDMNGGGSTGYGGTAMTAVLSKNAKIIDKPTLLKQIPSWEKAHPKAAAAIRKLDRSTGGGVNNFHNNSMSVYALAMGYNVISASTMHKGKAGYHNVIDRSALVILK